MVKRTGVRTVRPVGQFWRYRGHITHLFMSRVSGRHILWIGRRTVSILNARFISIFMVFDGDFDILPQKLVVGLWPAYLSYTDFFHLNRKSFQECRIHKFEFRTWFRSSRSRILYKYNSIETDTGSFVSENWIQIIWKVKLVRVKIYRSFSANSSLDSIAPNEEPKLILLAS